jgi:hypothetical protein
MHGLKRLTRDDTEHGNDYYLAAEVDKMLTAQQSEPVQKPVAQVVQVFDDVKAIGWLNSDGHPALMELPPVGTKFYTSPPAAQPAVPPEIWAMAFIEKMLEATPAHELLASQVFHELRKRANAQALATPPAQPAVPLTEKCLASACLSYRHDFGLMDETDRGLLMFQAREWARAFGLSITAAPEKGQP